MSFGYAYTPYVWPMLAAAAASAALAVYGWRRRQVPAARAFVLLAALGVPWALGCTLEAAAVDSPTRAFWFKFHAVWDLPAATAAFWFALEYADLRRRVALPKLTLLAIPPMAVFLLILASDAHHLVWETFSYDVASAGALLVLHAIAVGYRLLVAVATIVVFIWFSIKSPPHRPGAVLCISGLLLMRVAQSADALGGFPESHMHLCALAYPLMVGLHAVALFRFHDFALIPIARSSIVDQMREGMLVVNTSQKILDLNPAAERMLGLAAPRAKGCALSQVLPDYPHLSLASGAREATEVEMSVGQGEAARLHAVRQSPLVHHRGFGLGSLILLYDVTDKRRTQEQLVVHQRELATLQERARVARELHDSLGQVLGYVKMEAQAAREMLLHGRVQEVDQLLGRMAQAAQDAHSEVRDYILDSRADIFAETDVIGTLRRYLRRYSATCDIDATLMVEPGLDGDSFDPAVAWQLLRIIQEALTNVRKHAGTREVRVRLVKTTDCCGQATIEDHGAGFEPDDVGCDGQTFGLRFMRERVAQIGGSLRIESTPGQGTRVVATVPLRQVSHASIAG